MDNLTKIRIANKNYGQFSKKPIFVSGELKQRLEKVKTRRGTTVFENLTTIGFAGGKHLLERLSHRYGKEFKLILSHEPSSIQDKTITIDFEKFRKVNSDKFFAVYRETGLKAALEFLQNEFIDDFPEDEKENLPPKKDIETILKNLPEAVQQLSKKDQGKIPDQRKLIGDEIMKRDKKHARKRPDFACSVYGDSKLILIEIKRPTVELKKKELDQIEDYQLIIKKHKDNQYQSIEAILVGKKVSADASERANIRKGPKLMTYQDLLEGCRRRYQQYLDIVEKK